MAGQKPLRGEDETMTGGELLPRANPANSGWVSRGATRERDSELPTREMEGGVVGYVSRIDEIRRLYAEGATDDALLLAGTISPAPQLGWSLSSVPVLAREPIEIMKMALDHRAGFFLAHVDGEANLETILDLVPLPEGEVLALVESLVALGVIRLESPRAQRLQSVTVKPLLP
jgi:hypothetical protein